MLSQLDVSMLYKKIRGFQKYRVSPQNPKGLVFVFTGKLLFTTIILWKIVFQPLDTHILSRLDVLVLYTIFLGFENSVFRLKPQSG
jgi:hypothetical protein